MPGRDRIGQVKAQGEWLETRWGVRPTCGWVPHQIWEPTMADDLVEAELESGILLPDPNEKSRSRRSIRAGWFYTDTDGPIPAAAPAAVAEAPAVVGAAARFAARQGARGGAPVAHFEHTVALTRDGKPDILTLPKSDADR